MTVLTRGREEEGSLEEVKEAVLVAGGGAEAGVARGVEEAASVVVAGGGAGAGAVGGGGLTKPAFKKLSTHENSPDLIIFTWHLIFKRYEQEQREEGEEQERREEGEQC